MLLWYSGTTSRSQPGNYSSQSNSLRKSSQWKSEAKRCVSFSSAFILFLFFYFANFSSSIELKSQLRELFGKYGTILDVVASKRNGKKGQAFVVFDSVDEAQKAMSELQVLLLLLLIRSFICYNVNRGKNTLESLWTSLQQNPKVMLLQREMELLSKGKESWTLLLVFSFKLNNRGKNHFCCSI